MTKRKITGLSFAALVFSFAAALPADAQQSAELLVTVNDGTNTYTVTVTSAGVVTFGGACAPSPSTSCQTIGGSTASSAGISWMGDLGPVSFGKIGGTVLSGTGIQPKIDLGAPISSLSQTASITVSFSANGFTAGEAPSTLNTGGGLNFTTFSGYIDNNNQLLGETPTPLIQTNGPGQVTNPTGGATTSPYSMTVVISATVPADALFYSPDVSLTEHYYSPLTVACPAATTGTIGTSYTGSFVASGGNPPYTYLILPGGMLPPGLTFSGSTISGTVNGAGDYGFIGEVMDAFGATATTPTTCSINVPTGGGVQPPPQTLVSGDTATIGFWNNKNGQALILSAGASAGPTSTTLGSYLASYGNIFGFLAGASNNTVAMQFQTYFDVKGAKTTAQVMAGALACYFNNSASPQAAKYGFNLSNTCNAGYDVGSYATLLGLTSNAPSTIYTVGQILAAANTLAAPPNGWSAAVANALNVIFSGINQKGDIK